MLDRTQTSNRKATLILAATSASLKQNISKINLSKDTVRRTRQKHREELAKYIRESFKPDTALTIHWDSKLMKSSNFSESEDRLAILVSGQGITKLLAIPKIDGSTGINQATAVFEVISDWNLSNQVRSLCFDTTASNTGKNEGACIHLEKKLNKKMLHFACRHHILELILTAIFSSELEPAVSGPQIKLFERFKKKWPTIDKTEFEGGNIENRTKIRDFIYDQLKNQQPRDDYREFLMLSLIYLGETTGFLIYKPGAYHRARWMSKIIYCLKIYIFRGQFRLSKSELNRLKAFNDFIIEIYLKVWFLCQSPTTAPRTDLQLLKDLVQYKKKK
ncbi:uncharacterized protein LOC130670438 [Microplitis mediator]|uniref:uncharacterized protein LOC130670438 n=1 Tax=Microplitis mediator TaxID=375433 RepID=UPI002553CE8D|nr:uncharacterized protein LOC130670438 [Microplitis mediator]